MVYTLSVSLDCEGSIYCVDRVGGSRPLVQERDREMRSTTAKTFRLGLALPVALGLAIGSAGAVYAQQASASNGCASGANYQAQKTQGLPPSVQDRAQRADQEQLGNTTSLQAQKTQGLPPSVQDRAQRASTDVNPPCG